MKRFGWFGFLLAASMWTAPASAEVRRECLVSYERTSDAYALNRYSDPYKMSVSFQTGSELNNKTRTFNYDSFKSYALLWFGKGKVAIVKLKGFFTHSTLSPFDRSAFRGMFDFAFSGIEGRDKRGRRWKVECKKLGSYIDSREKNSLYY